MGSKIFTPLADLPPGYQGWRVSQDIILGPEDFPDVEALVIEDGEPVDNVFVEKQYRLLTEPLYSSWTAANVPFWALANVGLFYQEGQPSLAPDVMLSLGVPPSRDLTLKENRSYLMWIVGKPPDVVIEVVSDRRGGEDTNKMEIYQRIGVTYYIIFDPLNRLKSGILRGFVLAAGKYEPLVNLWLEHVGLGLMFWEGEFESQHARWLRWCDRNAAVLATGQERAEQEKQRAEQEKQRAEQEKQRADRLAAQLRALGIEPSA